MKQYILIGCKNNEIGEPLFFNSEVTAYHQLKIEMAFFLNTTIYELDRLACGDKTYLETAKIGYNDDEERYEGSCEVDGDKYSWAIIEHTFAG